MTDQLSIFDWQPPAVDIAPPAIEPATQVASPVVRQSIQKDSRVEVIAAEDSSLVGQLALVRAIRRDRAEIRTDDDRKVIVSLAQLKIHHWNPATWFQEKADYYLKQMTKLAVSDLPGDVKRAQMTHLNSLREQFLAKVKEYGCNR